MRAMHGFLSKWGDDSAMQNLKDGDKSKEVLIVEAENLIKEMALRFERSPNAATQKLWASDLINAGHSLEAIAQVTKMAPFKFDKHPTLKELIELLRPYLVEKSVLTDELDKYTQMVTPHLRAKFVRLTNEETLNKMCSWYKSNVIPTVVHNAAQFNHKHYEMCVLIDWLRTYFSSNPEAIIKQGLTTNQKALDGDRDYFLLPLKRYAKENRLD